MHIRVSCLWCTITLCTVAALLVGTTDALRWSIQHTRTRQLKNTGISLDVMLPAQELASPEPLSVTFSGTFQTFLAHTRRMVAHSPRYICYRLRVKKRPDGSHAFHLSLARLSNSGETPP